jgi:signal transduction histidine kinase
MKTPLEEIYDSTIKFLTPMRLEETYKEISKEAIRLMDGTMATIFMMEKSLPKRVFSTSPQLLPIKPRKKGYTYSVYKTKKPLVLNYEDMYKVHPEIRDTKMKYDIMVPLMNRNKAIGVLSVLSKKKSFNKDDLAMLNLFARLASLAIRKAQLYEDLDTSVKNRDLFISMASHELKTPVTTMYIYTQLLKNKVKKGQEFDLEWINTLLFEMTRLTKLIDELLELSQIKTGNFKYNFEEVNIIDLISKAIMPFRASHKKTKVIFQNETNQKEVLLVGDPDKLIQVITNILDNSAKHNVNNNPIRVNLKLIKHNIVLEVIDKGSGIKKEDLPNIFEEFYKGRGHTKSGMGLGLFLIKKIIDKHHGSIKIESNIDQGTKVTVKFKLLNYDA